MELKRILMASLLVSCAAMNAMEKKENNKVIINNNNNIQIILEEEDKKKAENNNDNNLQQQQVLLKKEETKKVEVVQKPVGFWATALDGVKSLTLKDVKDFVTDEKVIMTAAGLTTMYTTKSIFTGLLAGGLIQTYFTWSKNSAEQKKLSEQNIEKKENNIFAIFNAARKDVNTLKDLFPGLTLCECIKYRLEKYPQELTMTDGSGSTPLHHAVIVVSMGEKDGGMWVYDGIQKANVVAFNHYDFDVIEFLIKDKKVDILAKNNDGRTASSLIDSVTDAYTIKKYLKAAEDEKRLFNQLQKKAKQEEVKQQIEDDSNNLR